MRHVLLPAAAIGAALLTACGGGGDSAPPPPVRLLVTTPRDQAVVHEDHVEVAGTVRPTTAAVTVDGRRAAVSDGAFRATVALAAGTNVVDVLASAGRAGPALAAIRVRREITVRVPDLTGLSVDDAGRRLTGLGLKADVQREDSIFDRLLPGAPDVCATEPAPGAEVDPGRTIRLLAARRC